ncbi:MAG TPA: DedA family protein [Terriglobales bacterium]|nr:DedA family protein [Terriglobales bacterium]
MHPMMSMHWFYHTIRQVLTSWGYWAVLLGLLAESSGLPLPGETVLMFASFLANKSTSLQIQWVIVTGIGAAVLGDNIGYWLGHRFGKTFIRWARKIGHLEDEDIQTARDLLKRHGGRTIFFSRFIFGLRTIAGPLAGSLGMEWKTFLKFNVLGATTWVLAMAWAGFAFSNEFDTLLGYIEKASWAMAAGLFFAGYWIWRRQKRIHAHRHEKKAA